MFCKNCGSQMSDDARVCENCGTAVDTSSNNTNTSSANTNNAFNNGEPKSRLIAGLLGILVPLGIHSFYLGYTNKGIAQLILSLCCGVGAIWSFIDGILILVGNVNTDASGRPLKD